MNKFYLFTLLCILALTSATTTAQKAYIPNKLLNNVYVVDIATGMITATIGVGDFPRAVAVHENTGRVYIVNQGSDNVTAINTSDNSVAATVAVGSFPYGIALTPDGTKAYVINTSGNTVSVINTATNMVQTTIAVGDFPSGVAISPDGSKVYTANVNGGTVSVINVATDMVTATIPVAEAYNLVVSPDNSKVYVAGFTTDNISVIDASTNMVTATIPTGDMPVALDITADGSKLYVVLENANAVNVINTANNMSIATISVGTDPQGIDITKDDSKVLVCNFNSDNVSVIDIATNMVVTTLTGFASPTGYGNFIFAAALPGDICSDANDISPLFGGAINEAQVSAIQDNTGYNADNDPAAGYDCWLGDAPVLNNTIWYAFTGDGEKYGIRAVACGDTPMTGTDTQFALYSGDCTTPTAVTCNDDEDFNGGSYNSYLEIVTELGVDYLLMVDGYVAAADYAAIGTFCLQVTRLETVGVTDISTTEFKVYPNPTSSNVQLPQLDLERLEVYDLTGRLLLTQQQPGNSVDLAAQPAGLYLLKMYAGKEVYSAKVVKE